MSFKLKSLIYICIIAGLVLGAFGIVLAQFNEQINFQGKLTDNDNQAVEDGDYCFEFKLWSHESTTTGSYLKWTETCTSTDDKITVTDGLFSHLLGSVTSLSDSIFNQTLWLEVRVGTSTDMETLSPRKKLGAVPAAFEAKRLEGLLSSQFLRADATTTLQTTSSDTLLTVRQDGDGNIVDFKVGATSAFVIDNNGIITTGEWQGTKIEPQWGGTGQDWHLAATGSIPYFSALGEMDLLPSEAVGKGPTIIVAATSSKASSTADYVCDGDNDQVQINQAISDISSTGGTVLLLEGNYFIASSTDNIGINITTSSVSLIGSGKGTVLTRADDAFAMITVGDGGTTTVAGVVISNLQIDGQKGTYTNSSNYGIYFNYYVTKSQIRNNWIHDNYGDSIYLYGYCDNNLIRGNEIINDIVSYVSGVSVSSFSAYNVISANIIVKHGGLGGILIWSHSNNNVISGNNAQECNQDGIYLSSSAYNTISGNTVSGNKNSGIYIKYDDSYANTISGNTVQGNTYEGIHVRDAPYTSIVGNTVYNNGRDGIELEYPQNCVVSSNNIYDSSASGYYGIYISNASANNNYLIGNEISGNYDAEIKDDGTNTTIQQRDWFEVEQTSTSSSQTALTVTQSGTGNIVEFKDAGTSVFTIANNGYVTLAAAPIATSTAFLIQAPDSTWATGTATYFGISATSTFVGNFIEFLLDATSTFKVDESGNLTVSGALKNVATKIVAASDTPNGSARADYVCDGTSTTGGDQVEINNAITTLGSIGGVVHLLEGTFWVDDSINLTSNIALIGTGAGTVIKLKNAKNANINIISASSKNRILLQNFKIDGNRGQQSSGTQYGIYFTGTTYSKINKLWIENCRVNGIRFESSSNENTITDNRIYYTQGWNGEGIYISASSDNIISNNSIFLNNYGIKLTSSDDNTISGNYFYDNNNNEIELSSSHTNNITGNKILPESGTSSGKGIYLTSSNYNNISGNSIGDDAVGGRGSYAIQLASSDYNNIVGNNISELWGGVAYDAISLSDSDYNLISSNRIHDTSGNRYGINISSGSNNYLIGNEISGAGFTAEINDDGTNTTIQQRDWFEVEQTSASATNTALTVTQSGTGNIAEFTNTASATSTAFTITNLGSGDSFLVEDSTSTDSTPFVIDADGNVGIGTTTPAYALDVAGPIHFEGWQDLGVPTVDRYVYTLTVWNGKLCEGNQFGNVKCYDGSSWEDLGNVGDSVYALTVWNGKLCTGDNYGHIQCYNGSSWEDLGDPSGTHADVSALTVWNGKLCEGDHEGYVRCYDGSSWEDLGDVGNDVKALTVWNGKLCEGNDDDHVRCYDGSTWEDLGDPSGATNDTVYTLTVWNGKLCEGGSDDHVRCYNGSSWEDLGDVGSTTVGALTVWNGKLCEGDPSGYVKCYAGIGTSTEAVWEDLGDVGSNVYALIAWNGKLCEGNDDSHVKCYFDSDAIADYWYRQGDDIRYDYGNVYLNTAYVDGNLIMEQGTPLFSGTRSDIPYALISDEATINLVANPSFEVNVTDGWSSVNSATTTTSTEHYIGSLGMKIETPGSVPAEGAETATSSVATSTTYTASAFLKGSATTTVYMKLVGDDSGITTSTITLATTTFTRYNLSKTTNATDTTLKLQIVTAATTSATFYVDGVQLEQKSYPTTYCDGTLGPGYNWSGTVHNSTSTRTAGFRYLNPSKQFVLDTEGNLGVGSAAPVRRLEVKDTSDAQLRLTREDATQYAEFEVSNVGDLTVTMAGGDLILPQDNLWVCSGGACPTAAQLGLSGDGNLVVEGKSYFSGADIKYPDVTGFTQPKRSIILTAAGAITPDTGGASQTKVSTATSTYYVLDYADATTSSAFWEWVMPDSFATGTIDVTIYWTSASTSASTTTWGIETVGIAEDEDINSAPGDATTTNSQATTTANRLIKATISGYNNNNWQPEDYIIFKVYRDGGSDSFDGTARLVKVKIEYNVKQESD